MSLDQIRALIADARLHSNQAGQETQPVVITGLGRDAARFIADASRLADTTRPEVVHPGHGKGVVVGVTSGGMLEVHFDGQPYAVAVPVDSVREAP